jgi:sporulation protein YlmC with PRC-barrel domain
MGMGETPFRIGSEVACEDGPCAEVARVVVDPVARTLTHLVVKPKHGHAVERLVPIDLVTAQGDEVSLRCTESELEKLDAAEETHFLSPADSYAGYAVGEVLSWPYYSRAGVGGFGVLGGGVQIPEVVTTDTVPLGEVDVRRGDPVRASDGEIGRIQGLVVDADDHRVTHVLLQEGHLWGRKDVAIPIRSIKRVDDGIEVSLTKEQLQDLPAVEVEHPSWA